MWISAQREISRRVHVEARSYNCKYYILVDICLWHVPLEFRSGLSPHSPNIIYRCDVCRGHLCGVMAHRALVEKTGSVALMNVWLV